LIERVWAESNLTGGRWSVASMGVRLWRGVSIIDRLTLSYVTFVLLVVISRQEHVKHAEAIALIHLGLLFGIGLLAYLRARGNRVAATIGTWYPIFLFGFFFEEIGFIVHAFHPGWFDPWLISLEYRVLGVHATVWVEQYSSYWATEILQLAYTSYLVLTLGLAVYFARRSQETPLQILVVSTCVAYYLGYLIFVLFPIESPHHTLSGLQQVQLVGGPFTAVIDWIEQYGRVHGGAFPSAHVSGSVVVLICAWRYARRVGYALLPLVTAICIATVYGRYHYVADVLAGIVMALIGCSVGVRLVRAERSRIPSLPIR
jgi:membrane-associated phospholipid phosphatase